MTANERRLAVRDKYRIIIGRNKYSQSLRSYVNTKYKGNYYSDCSSSVCWAYIAAGYPISGKTLLNTVGLYQSKNLVDVPVTIKSGKIANPEVLRVGDLLLFAGTDSSRKSASYVGHVEMVGEINGSTVWLYGHGSGNPKRHEMNAYCKSRYSSKTSTALGNKGLIRVRRLIVDDGSEPRDPELGERALRNGDIGADVRELQKALISQGYSCGSCGIDGEFGPDTEAAVRKYQRAKGLPITGVADVETIAALTGTASAGAPVSPNTPTITIANCKECHIRTGPGTSFASVGTARVGDTFPACENPDNWVPVVVDAEVRWISSKYASKKG